MSQKEIISKLHRVEEYLGLPLSPIDLIKEDALKKLKYIRKEFNVII